MLLSLLLQSSIANAVPLQLTQQGRMIDSAGQPVDGAQIVIFRIYDDHTSGTKLWDETLTVQFNNGYYATVLGVDTSNPLDSEVLSFYPLYLELQLNSNPPMLPRQEVNSAPYAQMSGVAESVQGGTVNASEVQISSVPVIDSNRNWVGEPITIDWAQIQNMPSSISDGDDNTQLSEQQVENYLTNDAVSLHQDTTLNGQEILTLGMDSDTLADISCTAGDIPKYDGTTSSWYCDMDADTLAGLNCSLGEVAKWDGSAWNCGTSTDTLSALSCSAGQVAYFDGTNWSCQDSSFLFDQDGDKIPSWEDCDDSDATSYSTSDDGDCDGTPTANDCDDADPLSLTKVDDYDCDGVIAIQDCDDEDPNSTTIQEDSDCDGDKDVDDCDDSDETIFNGATEVCGDGIDQDCDGSDMPCFGGATISTCGQSGHTGPTQSMCDGTYSNTEVAGEIQVNDGIQSWVVPQGITSLRIQAYGASGGLNHYCTSYPGGKGARMEGTFTVNPGDTLNFIVGQQGQDGGSNAANYSGSGGGGSFVWVEGDSQPLIVAGGGGSGAICESGGNTSDAPGMDGVTTENGTSDRRGVSSGGTNGGDGSNQGAGKGWNTIQSNPNGDSNTSPVGGFGGGGAQSGSHSGGGGGGYSGGGACPYGTCSTPASGGGGGGSYNVGTTQSNGAGANNGDGYIVISIPN